MTDSTYAGGVSETRAYNTDNTLTSISFRGTALQSYSYGWDDNKNKPRKTITGTMANYGFAVGTGGYNTEDRLVNWERAGSNLDQSWNISLVGDWHSIIENAGYIDEPVLRYEPSATVTFYYHRNQQYSVIALTDGTGVIEERYAYCAYGEPVFISASGTMQTSSVKHNRYAYTGREWDEEQTLYHFRVRMHDAESEVVLLRLLSLF